MRAVVIRLAISIGLVASAWVAVDYLADPAANQLIPIQALAASTGPDSTTTSATTTTLAGPATTGPATTGSTTTGPTTTGPTTTGPPPTSPPSSGPATTEAAPTTLAANDHDGRGAAALGVISYPWQSKLPGWTIEFGPSRSGVLGYTFTNEKRIEIYVRDSMSDGLLAHVVAHEIGHAVDVSRNSGAERRSWLDARGVPDAPWWPGEGGVSDFKSGTGDFAEGFAAWQVGTGSYRSKLGPAPNSEQLELIAQLAN